MSSTRPRTYRYPSASNVPRSPDRNQGPTNFSRDSGGSHQNSCASDGPLMRISPSSPGASSWSGLPPAATTRTSEFSSGLPTLSILSGRARSSGNMAVPPDTAASVVE